MNLPAAYAELDSFQDHVREEFAKQGELVTEAKQGTELHTVPIPTWNRSPF